MEKKPNLPSSKPNQDLMRYAGWGTQLFVLLALALWGGSKLDGLLKLSFPLLVWLLPFVVLIIMIWQLIRDTSKRKNKE